MKIDKLDKSNIKEFMGNMKISDDTLNSCIDKLNMFGIKEDDKFIASFIPTDDFVSLSFGNNKIIRDKVLCVIDFLNNYLSFEGHLFIQVDDSRLIDILDDIYRVKDITTSKDISDDYSDINRKDKYAEIDMRSIKYSIVSGSVYCNLYSQNIQNIDIIKKLDEYFSTLSVKSIVFCIVPDSLDYMISLGYSCSAKRYVIE